MKKIEAIKDKIVVELIKDIEEKTDGGIIIPETSKKEPQSYGTVVSIGSDVKGVTEGDTISFHQRAGQDIILNNKLMKVLTDAEVYGIIRER